MSLEDIANRIKRPVTITGLATYLFFNTVIPNACAKPEPVFNPPPVKESIATDDYTPVVNEEVVIVEEPIASDEHTIQKPVYTQEEWDYFNKIVFGSEYENSNDSLVKWSYENPPLIFVYGSVTDKNEKPSKESINTLETVVEELKDLTKLDIQFTDDSSKANFRAYLDVPHSDLYKIFPDMSKEFIDANVGLFYFYFDDDYSISKATVAISSTHEITGETLSRSLRNHLIREEVTQSLGLANDFYRYPQSIFQQEYSSTQEFLPIDRRIIELLYGSAVKPGMTPSQVEKVIQIVE